MRIFNIKYGILSYEKGWEYLGESGDREEVLGLDLRFNKFRDKIEEDVLVVGGLERWEDISVYSLKIKKEKYFRKESD